MENDSIRASGSDTLVDVWINEKMRAIAVTRGAIETFLGFEKAAGMSEDARCEFVRTRLSLVVTAAKAKLSESNSTTASIIIDVGDLGSPAGGTSGERRKGDRRKGERRKVQRRTGELPLGERRRGDRRKRDRRSSPKKD